MSLQIASISETRLPFRRHMRSADQDRSRRNYIAGPDGDAYGLDGLQAQGGMMSLEDMVVLSAFSDQPDWARALRRHDREACPAEAAQQYSFFFMAPVSLEA
ncbi:MAG: hypothetical protein HYU57_07560 [Micavibrio aeruginosavorus]|nr:hypothetical protein [Micavibrio aeruginosavorus]